MYSLETLPFNNRFATLSEDYYSRVQPTPLSNSHLIHFNTEAAKLIQLNEAEAQRPEFLEYFSGQRLFEQGDPLAMLYSGHQFGGYNPQLGDGRAIMLGESQGWELQLKGAGQTPYSRFADGRAVLRSTIREYLCSEAMHALGIPTTRALCMLGSDEEVYRERIETGALVLRMAESHIRFGNFEIFFHRRQYGKLKVLADFVLEHYYPDCLQAECPYQALLTEITIRTSNLIKQWQLVGFAHGVMNTDNMSILGLTLDYGPYGFLDTYDENFICNHSDHSGRYAFNQQPAVGLWNLNCLAHAFLPLLDNDDADKAVAKARLALEFYQPTYEEGFTQGMQAKLGLMETQESDHELARQLLALLQKNQVDYTIFFRRLAQFTKQGAIPDTVRDFFLDREAFDAWGQQYQTRLQQEPLSDEQRAERMNRVNPKYILRNYMAEQAIVQAERGDYSEIDTLMTLLKQPFSEQPEYEAYADHPPAWASEIAVSCSS